MPHIENHDRIYRAVIDHDRDPVYEAFTVDPLIKGRLDSREIRKLVDEMIEKTGKYCKI